MRQALTHCLMYHRCGLQMHLLEAGRYAREAMHADLLDWRHLGHAGTAYGIRTAYLNIRKRFKHRNREVIGNVGCIAVTAQGICVRPASIHTFCYVTNHVDSIIQGRLAHPCRPTTEAQLSICWWSPEVHISSPHCWKYHRCDVLLLEAVRHIKAAMIAYVVDWSH
jgi:hypothetical protein